MSKRNENRPGYKSTKVGWIPNDWDINTLNQVGLIRSSNVDKKSLENQKTVFLCNYMDVFHNEYITHDIEFMEATASDDEIVKFKLRLNDVLITKDSETREDIASTAYVIEDIKNLICGYHLSIIRPKEKVIDGLFLSKLLIFGQIHNYFVTHANGATRYGLTLDTLNNVIVFVPPFHEQRKIARILSAWDKAIELVSKQVKAKQRLKKGLMQQLLTGKMRFPGFNGGWHEIQLGQFLEMKLRKVEKPEVAYLRLGIRSHGRGTFTTIVEDPSSVNMTHLFQVRKGDLVVSITFAWEGAIAMVEVDGDGAHVSHRFPTYLFDTKKVIPDFFRYLMHTPRFFYDLGCVSPGGAGRNRVMSKRNFLKIKVKVPSVEEQRKIGGLLTSLDEEINEISQILEKLKTQKKGLMQKLLTGEVRV